MARDVESLVLRMSADIRSMEKALSRAQSGFDRTADAIERRQRQLDRNLANLGREAGNFAQPIQAGAALALGAITALSYQAAKRAEAVNGAFEQTFRDMPREAAQATAKIAEEFGRLETDIKDNFTQLRSVLTALGVDAQQALTIVDQLQRRSLDIAAFRDVSDADAFRAVISGITGETEPLKRFGIVLNETAVKAELVRLGFKGNAEQASEAAKVIARTNIIMRQSAEMHGQVARESETLAEQEKRTRAEFTRAAEQFGKQFLPVAAKVLGWASDALKAFNDLPSGVQTAGLALLAFVAASGPIGAAITGLRALIAAAIAARGALAAIGGTAGAGAVGRGAAAGGAAGVAARVAPVAAGAVALGVGIGSLAPAPGPNDFVNDPNFVARRLGESEASWRARGGRTRSEWEAERRRRRTPSGGTADAATTADQEARAALAGLGDFGLSEAQRSAKGTGGGGRSGSAAAAERVASARATLALELAIAQARAAGDQAGIHAAEERQELARLVGQYEAAGYEDATARATEHLAILNQAEVRSENLAGWIAQSDAFWESIGENARKAADAEQLLNEQAVDRLSLEAQLAQLGGSDGMIRDAEQRLFIHERTLEILRLQLATTKEQAAAMASAEWDQLGSAEGGREMARGIVELLRSDNIWEEAGRRFKDAAWDGIENLVSQLLGTLGAGGKGGGFDLFGSLKGLIPGFSKGVTNFQGGLAYVHKGEVLTNLPQGTSVIPAVNAAMAGVQSTGGGRDIRVSIHLDGANGDETIRQIAYEAAAQGVGVAIGANRIASQQAQRRQRQRFA